MSESIVKENTPEEQIKHIKEFLNKYFNRPDEEIKNIIESSESFKIQRGEEFLICVCDPENMGELLVTLFRNLPIELLVKISNEFLKDLNVMMAENQSKGETIQ